MKIFNFFRNKQTKKFSEYYLEFIENLFYKIGYNVGFHPWKVIIITFTISIILSFGNIYLSFEKDPIDLWVPKYSKYRQDTELLLKTHEEGYREQVLIIKNVDNILKPENLKRLAIINKEILNFNVKLSNGTKILWEDVCFRIPSIVDYVDTDNDDDDEYYDDDSSSLEGYNKSITSEEKSFNPVIDLHPDLFCKIVNTLKNICYQKSILELWKYDIDVISNLTLNDVLNKINSTKISPVSGHPIDIKSLLGGIEYDENDKIISAKTLMSNYYLYLNLSKSNSDIVSISGAESWVTEDDYLWEEGFIDILDKLKLKFDDKNFTTFYEARRSLSDSFDNNITDFLYLIVISSIFMIVFIQIVLSKFNMIEFRFILTLSGLMCVGISLIVTCGIASYAGISLNVFATTFPLLLIGLGVDDMFVIMASWRKFESLDKPIPEKIGLTLKNSAISITVTTVTDLVAFLVGTNSYIPLLQIYCIYSAIGVFVIYCLVITKFIAVLALDEQRILSKRNAFVPCIIHSDNKISPKSSEKFILQIYLRKIYENFLFTKIGKVIILSFTLGFSVFCVINITKLEKFEDLNEYIPKDIPYYGFLKTRSEYYTNYGQESWIYISPFDLNSTENLLKFEKLSKLLKNESEFIVDVDSWIEPFNDFVKIHFKQDIFNDSLTEDDRRFYLSKFLFSTDGGKYQENILFDTKLKCGELTPNIKMTSISFSFKQKNRLKAMRRLNDISNEYNFENDQYSMVWGFLLSIWNCFDIVDVELAQNIILALICVSLCTAVMIFNIRMCLFIFLTILITIINIGGSMYVLDLQLSLMTTLTTLIAIGLCVDYAAHIGHTFLTISDGDRNKRAIETVVHIGPAILNGAISTVLAISSIWFGSLPSAIEFLKGITSIIVFGLFNGIIVLPTILSLIGPEPYKAAVEFNTKL